MEELLRTGCLRPRLPSLSRLPSSSLVLLGPDPLLRFASLSHVVQGIAPPPTPNIMNPGTDGAGEPWRGGMSRLRSRVAGDEAVVRGDGGSKRDSGCVRGSRHATVCHEEVLQASGGTTEESSACHAVTYALPYTHKQAPLGEEPAELLRKVGRDDRIRTCDPLTPSQVRYQAALHPDTWHDMAASRPHRALLRSPLGVTRGCPAVSRDLWTSGRRALALGDVSSRGGRLRSRLFLAPHRGAPLCA